MAMASGLYYTAGLHGENFSSFRCISPYYCQLGVDFCRSFDYTSEVSALFFRFSVWVAVTCKMVCRICASLRMVILRTGSLKCLRSTARLVWSCLRHCWVHTLKYSFVWVALTSSSSSDSHGYSYSYLTWALPTDSEPCYGYPRMYERHFRWIQQEVHCGFDIYLTCRCVQYAESLKQAHQLQFISVWCLCT